MFIIQDGNPWILEFAHFNKIQWVLHDFQIFTLKFILINYVVKH